MTWINTDTPNIVPEPQLAALTDVTQPLSWRAAWLNLREVLRPHPDAFAAASVFVQRLLDDCDKFGDPGEPKTPPAA